MKSSLLVVSCLLCSISFGFAQEGVPPTPKEHKEFAGVWKPILVEHNGKKEMSTEAEREPIRLSVENGLYKIYVIVDPMKKLGRRVASAKLTVDPKAKTFGLTFEAGANKGQKLHGIYQVVDGNLHLCYGPENQARPTEFTSQEGSGVFHEVWEAKK